MTNSLTKSVYDRAKVGPEEMSRRFHHDHWEHSTLSAAYDTCPFCLHTLVDGPKTNQQALEHNLLAGRTFQDAKRAAENAPDADKKIIRNPTVSNGMLKPILLHCHCHQKNNGGIGSITCVRCREKKANGTFDPTETCEICECPCAQIWEVRIHCSVLRFIILHFQPTHLLFSPFDDTSMKRQGFFTM